MTLTLPDGRVFPTVDGQEALAWSLDLYNTIAESRHDYPRMRAIAAEMTDDQLRREEADAIRGSFDPLFGHHNKPVLRVVRAEMARRRTN